MKKINFKLLLLIYIGFGVLIVSACTSSKAVINLNKKEIDPVYYSYGEKSIIFAPMTHLGQEEFYRSLKDSITNWKANNYTIYYEQIIVDKDKIGIDSLSYDLIRRKLRKIIDFSKYTREYYHKKGSSLSDKIISQPEYVDLGITNSDINVDITIYEMVTEYERLYGNIELLDCDYFFL